MRTDAFVALSLLLLGVLGGLCWVLYGLAGELNRIRDVMSDPVGRELLEASLQETLAPTLVAGTPEPVGDRIRLCSYNIENFSDGTGDGRLRSEEAARKQARAAAALLAKLDPDVIFIQELENSRVLQWLNESFEVPYALGYVTRLGDHGHAVKLNLGILSRHALSEVVEIDFGPLQGTDLPPRGVLRCTLPIGNDRRLLVYGVHLKSNYGDSAKNVNKRRKALQVVAEDLRQVAGDAGHSWEVVVLGDMNTDPDVAQFANDPSLSPLGDLHDLWRGQPIDRRTTVPTRHGNPDRAFPPAAFDRILVADAMRQAPWTAGEPQRIADGVNTRDVEALPGLGGAHVSDHYPVYIDLHR